MVDAYDKLTPDQQARLGLRGEALEYMAVAFTQVGGAEAANQYFATRGGSAVKLPVIRRVAQSLRDQVAFPQAVDAYRAVIAEAPTDSSALAAQQEIIDIYQNRMLEPAQAQAARLELADQFAPGTPWASANPGLASQAATAREAALRQSGQYLLAQAQRGTNRAQFAEAAGLYSRYLNEFASADSAQAVNLLYAEALFGQGEFMRAGAEYSRAAYGRSAPAATTPATPGDSMSVTQRAGQNAIVAFDSAFVRDSTSQAVQDSLFRAVDNFVRAFPQTEQAKRALIQKGRRASQAKRWDVMAETFRTYASTYPNDAYTPTAQKLVGDALFRAGQYAEAQTQWENAATIARNSGRRALADSITRTRETAAGTFADTLIRQGQYQRAAEEAYVAFADRNPTSEKAPEALRDAIATYVTADSVARLRNDEGASRQARERIVELTNRLVSQYPTYRYRLQYQALGAQTLADLGRKEESVEALRRLVNDNPTWTGRANAMVTIAQRLDSLGRKAEAAAAYAAFAEAFPRDARSADAQFNAGVTYLEAGDTTASARAFGRYAERFPRGARAADARTRRAALLLAAGDTAAANAEFGRMCAQNASANREACASYRARQAFESAVGTFDAYKRIQFVIRNKNQVASAAALRTVQAPKRTALERLATRLRAVINLGVAEQLAGATYYLGLAQWEYGNYLKNIQLPATGFTDEERAAATTGAATLAEREYAAARETWQALLTKAEAEETLRNDPGAQRWIQLARDAIAGNVPAEPPPPAMNLEGIR